MRIQPLEWNDGGLRFLDQTLLPHREVFVRAETEQVVADAIVRLGVRGAPLIGIAAAYGVAVAAFAALKKSPAEFRSRVAAACDLLASTRPTAVNLFHALDRQRRIISASADDDNAVLAQKLLAEAQRIHREEVEMCERIAEHGAGLPGRNSSVITHCNTGALATGGRGTALGIISRAWELGKIDHVFVDETRPLLQGSRLTAWELRALGIPFTIVTDSAAASVMQSRRIDGVFVGADRIAANGDTANKIGTYPLAIAARYHGVPFFVAAPVSTIDMATVSGDAIPVERRGEKEVTEFAGVSVAPEGSAAFAPAFDVTPASLITGIVTDRGIARPPSRETIAAIVGSGTAMER